VFILNVSSFFVVFIAVCADKLKDQNMKKTVFFNFFKLRDILHVDRPAALPPARVLQE